MLDERLARLAMRTLHQDRVQLAEEDLIDHDAHLAKDRAVAHPLFHGGGRRGRHGRRARFRRGRRASKRSLARGLRVVTRGMVRRVIRIIPARLRKGVGEVGLRVRELGHAPARPDELEYHAPDLVQVHGLANALRDRLTNVARERCVRVRFRAEEVDGGELADRRVLPLAVGLDSLHVQDLGAALPARDPVVPHRLASQIELGHHLELRGGRPEIIVAKQLLTDAVEAHVGDSLTCGERGYGAVVSTCMRHMEGMPSTLETHPARP